MTLAQWLANLGAWSAQVAALVLVAALAAAGLRVTGPRARLALWQGLLALCLALPLVQPWLPAPMTSASVLEVPLGPVPARVDAPLPIDPAPSRRSAFPVGQAVAAVLVLGTLARLAWLGIGFARLARLRRGARPLDQAAAPFAGAIDLVRVRATVAVSDAVGCPVTFGVRRPIVLVPASFAALPPDVQTAVVCHELLHVRRRDWLWSIAEALVTAGLWFHPAVWWLVAEIELSREQVIDREVVALAGGRRPYAQALVHLASPRAPVALAPAAYFLRRRHLARRMALLLMEAPMSKPRLVASLTALAIVVSGAGHAAMSAFPLVGAPPPAVPMIVVVQDVSPTSLLPGEGIPRRIHYVAPVYPPEAKAARIPGTVRLALTIEPDGTVSDARVEWSVPIFDQAAIDAVKQWRYEPLARQRQMSVTLRFQPEPDRHYYSLGFEPRDLPPPPLVHKVLPAYPATMRGFDRTAPVGTAKVTLEIKIAPDGRVADVRNLAGRSGFIQPSIDAVREWRYEPPGRTHLATVQFRFTPDGEVQLDDAPPFLDEEDGVIVLRPPLRRPSPAVPWPASSNGVIIVKVELMVDADGHVTSATPLDGPEELYPAALAEAKSWTFKALGEPKRFRVEFVVGPR